MENNSIQKIFNLHNIENADKCIPGLLKLLRSAQTEQKHNFMQGCACVISKLIVMDRGVETDTREVFRACLGEYVLKKFRSYGIDEYDLEVFKKYRKQLIR